MVKDYNSITEFNEIGPDQQTNGFYLLNKDQLARFSVSQSKGKVAQGVHEKSYQEDAMALANVPVIGDPKEYFREHFAQMIADNKDNPSGATASMYYCDLEKKLITVANLGDSRVYLIVKNPNAPEGAQYKTILLTQDHNPSLQRIKDIAGKSLQQDEFPEMDGNKGYIKYSINHKNDSNKTFGVGGAISDNGFLMLREPDIININLQHLSILAHKGVDINNLEFTVVNACDGLTNDSRDENYDLAISYKDTGEIRSILNGVNSDHNLSKIIARASDYGQSLAEYLMNDANKNVAGDNISVSTFHFKGDEIGKAGVDPVIGMVFDGHSHEPETNPSKVQTNCIAYMKRQCQELNNSQQFQGSAASIKTQEGSKPAAGPDDQGGIGVGGVDPKIAAQSKINEAINAINFAIANPRPNSDSEVIDTMNELVLTLNNAIKEMPEVADDGKVNLPDLVQGKNHKMTFGRDNSLLIDDKPAVQHLRRKLFNATVLEYKNTKEYKNRLQTSKTHALKDFAQNGNMPILSDVKDQVDFSKPFNLAFIQTSSQVNQAIEYSVFEEIAAFKIAVEENFDNPKPTTPYRGIGAKLNIMQYDEGGKFLEISEIFSAGNQRFKIETVDEIQTNPIEEDVLAAMQNAKITKIWIDGKPQDVSIILDQEDGIKQITTAFHADGKVKFEIEKINEETNEVIKSTVTCDNSRNRTAIFTPTDPREPETPEKTSFTALSDGLSKDGVENGFYYEASCDKAIARGKLFTDHLERIFKLTPSVRSEEFSTQSGQHSPSSRPASPQGSDPLSTFVAMGRGGK